MTKYEINARHKHSAAKREVAYRKYVYPGQVSAGKMPQEKADYQIAVMQAIADDYAEEAAQLEAEDLARARERKTAQGGFDF